MNAGREIKRYVYKLSVIKNKKAELIYLELYIKT